MLTVKIFSFSYKKSGIPKDTSANGGGFVFDCRFIYNPGREEKFMTLTGADEQVAGFMDRDNIMQEFLKDAFAICDKAVDNYVKRDFHDLMISFGCTGGQHRSVYSAIKLKNHLENKYKEKIKVLLYHKEFPELNR